MKILFLGNSATFVHEIPKKFQRLCFTKNFRNPNPLNYSFFYSKIEPSTERSKRI